jgi:hypothetical protein
MEAMAGENVPMKISMGGRIPPLTLTIKYLDNKKSDLTLYVSQDDKDPSSKSNNGVFTDVSPSLCLMIVAFRLLEFS